MSTDLIALVVAIGLGTVVVVVGLRRDLSETTRSNLPRFGNDAESTTATVRLWEGERRGRPLSPRQARWLASLYLLLGLFNAARLVLSPGDKLFHLAAAVAFTLGAVLLWLRKWPYSSAVASGHWDVGRGRDSGEYKAGPEPVGFRESRSGIRRKAPSAAHRRRE